MEASKLRDMNVAELRQKETELRKELFNLRFQKATGQLGNTALIGKTKRDLARTGTVRREIAISGGKDRRG